MTPNSKTLHVEMFIWDNFIATQPPLMERPSWEI
jgi:hypothetical protein